METLQIYLLVDHINSGTGYEAALQKEKEIAKTMWMNVQATAILKI